MTLDGLDLWTTSNPPWGTVRAVVIDGEYALILDDSNSDYREVELSILLRTDDGWLQIVEQDDVGFPETGQSFGGGWSARPDGDGGYGWVAGRELSNHVVQLIYKGEPTQVQSSADGWWMCVRATDAEGEYDIPSKLASGQTHPA